MDTKFNNQSHTHNLYLWPPQCAIASYSTDPDGSHPVVWWPDATVGYFSGKHVVLWAVAAIILVAGVVYTAILSSWQWLLYYQHKGFSNGLFEIKKTVYVC